MLRLKIRVDQLYDDLPLARCAGHAVTSVAELHAGVTIPSSTRARTRTCAIGAVHSMLRSAARVRNVAGAAACSGDQVSTSGHACKAMHVVRSPPMPSTQHLGQMARPMKCTAHGQQDTAPTTSAVSTLHTPLHAVPSAAGSTCGMDATAGWAHGATASGTEAPNNNKQFVKGLRGARSVRELEVLLDATADWPGGGRGLDAQSVTAIASKLSQVAGSSRNSHISSSGSRSDSSAGALVFLSQRWLPLLARVGPSLDAAGVCICAVAVAKIADHAGGARDGRALEQAGEVLMGLWEAAAYGTTQAPPARASGSSNSSSGVARGALAPRAAAQMLWALARMGVEPPQPWLRRWAAASHHLLPTFNAQDLSMALWAAAALGWVPPAQWLRGALAALTARVHELGPQALATCVWAIARLACAPAPELLDAVLQRATHLLQLQPSQGLQTGPHDTSGTLSAQPQALAMLVYSLAALQHQPSPAFVAAFVDAAPVYLSAAKPKELVLLAMSAANWRATLSPGSAWTEQLLTSVQSHLMQLTCQGLVVLLDALAQSGHAPPATWMVGYEAALSRRLYAVSAQAAAQVLGALGALRYVPGQALGTALVRRMLSGARYKVPAKRWFPGLLGAACLGLLLPTQSEVPAAKHISSLSDRGRSTAASHSPGAASASVGRGGDQEPLAPRPQAASSSMDNSEALAAHAREVVRIVLSASREKLAYCRAHNVAQLVWAAALLQAPTATGAEMQGVAAVAGAQLLPDSLLPSLLPALRQKLPLASASDLVAIMGGLAQLLLRTCPAAPTGAKATGLDVKAVRSEATSQLASAPDAAAGAKHAAVLTQDQLELLLQACGDTLPTFSLPQLLSVLDSVVVMGATLPAHPTTGPMPHVHGHLLALCSRAMQLVVQLQPGTGAHEGNRAAPAPPIVFRSWDGDMACSSHAAELSSSSCSSRHVAVRRGVAAQLFSLATDLRHQPLSTQVGGGLESAHSTSADIPVAGAAGQVLHAWRILLRLGYFHAAYSPAVAGEDMGDTVGSSLHQHRRQQQLCLAMYRAAEAHVTEQGLQDDVAICDLMACLAAQMLHAPPGDWMDGAEFGGHTPTSLQPLDKTRYERESCTDACGAAALSVR